MIQQADRNDIPALIRLWGMSFGEEESARIFYDMAFSDTKTIVYRHMDEIVSMLHYIPFVLEDGQGKYSGVYLYALATDETYRKQGIMQKLIDYAAQLAHSEGKDFLFLIPASEKLYEYYAKHGFVDEVSEPATTNDKNIVFDKAIEEFTMTENQMYGGMEPAAKPGIKGLIRYLSGKLNISWINGNIPY